MQSFPLSLIIEDAHNDHLHRDVTDIINEYLTIAIKYSLMQEVLHFYTPKMEDNINRLAINLFFFEDRNKLITEGKFVPLNDEERKIMQHFTYFHSHGFKIENISSFIHELRTHMLAPGVTRLVIVKKILGFSTTRDKIIFDDVKGVTTFELS